MSRFSVTFYKSLKSENNSFLLDTLLEIIKTLSFFQYCFRIITNAPNATITARYNDKFDIFFDEDGMSLVKIEVGVEVTDISVSAVGYYDMEKPIKNHRIVREVNGTENIKEVTLKIKKVRTITTIPTIFCRS